MKKKSLRDAWQSDDMNAAKTLILNREYDYKNWDKLTRYPLLANGAALITCFTALGTGWDKPGLITTITDVIPWFTAGLGATAISIFFLELYEAQVRYTQQEISRNSWSKGALKAYRIGAALAALMLLSSLAGVALFFGSIFYTTIDAQENNLSSVSKIQMSTASFDNGSIFFSVLNSGGRDAILDRMIPVTVDIPNAKHIVGYLNLPKSESPFVQGNQQKNIAIDLLSQFSSPSERSEFITSLQKIAANQTIADSAICNINVYWQNFSGYSFAPDLSIDSKTESISCPLLFTWAITYTSH